MNKKSAAHTAAVIEIGTHNVRMRVSQMSKGRIVPLDNLEYPLRLDHDVFEQGAISFESLRELSAILEKFSSALLSYNVQKPWVISCTALREAENRSLVVDQLRVRNGLEITVLDDSQEKAYIYAEVLKKLEDAEITLKGNTVLAYVGSGSIGLAVYDGKKIIYSQSISMGALKLSDVLRGVQSASEDFHTVIEEYLDTILGRISISEFPVSNLVLTGSQIGLIAGLCGAGAEKGVYRINSESMTEMHRAIRSLNPESIALHYNVSERQAEILYTALAIYEKLLWFCPKAKAVYSPEADISEAFMRCVLSPKAESERAANTREFTLACAETTARRFGCNLEHSQCISGYAVRLFDKLKRIHGLDPGKRLILELASILHSCGSFVSVRQHNQCTFDLIKGMDLFGLSRAEVLEVAFVAGSISTDLAMEKNLAFIELSTRERLVISKLAAIFQMANALDKSHRGKLRDLKVSIEDDRVLFKAAASGNTLLEQWAFAEAAQYFKDVFGLSPELSVKFELL